MPQAQMLNILALTAIYFGRLGLFEAHIKDNKWTVQVWRGLVVAAQCLSNWFLKAMVVSLEMVVSNGCDLGRLPVDLGY